MDFSTIQENFFSSLELKYPSTEFLKLKMQFNDKNDFDYISHLFV